VWPWREQRKYTALTNAGLGRLTVRRRLPRAFSPKGRPAAVIGKESGGRPPKQPPAAVFYAITGMLGSRLQDYLLVRKAHNFAP
jgi:hypothetical protein